VSVFGKLTGEKPV